MNTAQPMDIGALDKEKGKEKGNGKKDDEGKDKGEGQTGAGRPRGKANENPDKDVQCFHCGKKGYRKTCLSPTNTWSGNSHGIRDASRF